MAAINTEKFRKNNAEALLEDIETAGSVYYIGIGKSDAWYESLPEWLVSPFPKGTRLDEKQVLDSLVTLVKVIPADASIVIPRVTASVGDAFKVYNPYDPSCFYPSGGKKACYAVEADRIYLCISAPADTVTYTAAGAQPFSSFVGPGIQNIGGYVWTYLGAFNQYSTLANNQFIPISNEALAGSATYSSLTINPTGADNTIILSANESGVAGNNLTAEIEIDDYLDPQSFTADETASDILIISGDKRIMTITADFGDGAVTADLFTAEPFLWTSDGESSPSTGQIRLITAEDGVCVLSIVDALDDPSFEVATVGALYWPDELDWSTPTVAFGATGIPVFVAHPENALNTVALINSSDFSAFATLGTDSDGSGFIDTFAQTNFTGGAGTGDIVTISNSTGGIIHGLTIADGGAGYTNATSTSIVFEGILANGTYQSETVAGFTLNVTSGAITSITFPTDWATWPQGYVSVKATIVPGLETVPAKLFAHVGPTEGFGYKMVDTLPSWYVSVGGNTNLEIESDVLSQYRQISLVRNPKKPNGDLCSLQSISAAKSFTLTGYVPNIIDFIPGVYIYQNDLPIGVLIGYSLDDPESPTSCTVYYNQTVETGFRPINPLLAITVDNVATLTLPTIIEDKYKKGTGEVVFIENRSTITQVEGQNEEIKIVIQL